VHFLALGLSCWSRLCTLQEMRSPPQCRGFDIAVAICYAISKNANVINLSLGGLNSSQTMYDVLQEAAVDHHISIVTAAGNEGKSTRHFPAAYAQSFPGEYEAIPGLISVGAVEKSGLRAAYSNSGSWVDIMAPGGGNEGGIYTEQSTPGSSNYDYFIGTSFAAPFVTGTAALILAKNPNLTPAQVKERIILNGLTSVGNCSPNACGAGLLDVTKSISMP
jgi:serine protease